MFACYVGCVIVLYFLLYNFSAYFKLFDWIIRSLCVCMSVG